MTTNLQAGQIPATTSILMQALKFNSKDLAHNQEGELSPRQKGRLQPPRMEGIGLWVLLGHVALIIGILGAIAIFTGHWILLVIALFVGGMAGMPLVMVRDQKFMKPDLAQDVDQGKVISVCGETIRYARTDTEQAYYVVVDEMTFKVTSQVYSGFHQEGSYCVYYLPRSRMILSAERIG
ncbi:hypothetical protein G4Y79_23485 [Phototrophicus methaneseepsis]|uniref:DUF3592 domain-containing protein n=1 Tax=Phototrophicus methaneseepsis TaxID=2710758 RepID=A0A7S8E913_9CHLR|nr:hypothetical protein [Phototrophicus methaneseepsis]QPC82615.1 hypothetical protein G4Y79_23485 [Phototrophicus methaneseepsis]